MAGNFTDSEKILYSLKYALLKATVDPENPDYLEPVAPPRVFPTNVMSQSLIEKGVGDINSDGTYGGAASISGTVDLTKPWNIVKWYYIIDPTTNVITGNTVNDAITTQAVAETLPSGATSGSAASGSTSYTYYQEYFYGGNVPNATGVPSARTSDYKGLRLAYSKATIGTVCAEGNANLVPHISLYLQAPTSWVSPSGTKGDGDNWSYRNPHFRNLLGAEVGFEVSVNSYESGGKRAKIGYNTAGTATEFFWYTQASYGLLSFYGQTTSGFGGDGQANKPYLTFCRYIGESGTLGGGSSGGGGGATTLNALTDVTSSGATDGQALVWDNAASTWKPGSVAAASSGGGSGTTGQGTINVQGQVLEKLAGIPDGRSITVSSGTYTLENVNAMQNLSHSTSYTKANGSGISYKPPAGTKQVLFKYTFHTIGATAPNYRFTITAALKIGNSYTENIFQNQRTGGTGSHVENEQEYVFIIDIGSVATDDITNGKLASWDTVRQLELGVKTCQSDYAAKLFAVMTKGSTINYSGMFTPPRLVIEAIGESKVGTFVLTDGIRNISDIHMYPRYEVTASSTFNVSNSSHRYQPWKAFQSSIRGINEYETHWSGHDGNYNTSTGAFQGSYTTNGYAGDWLQINLKRKATVNVIGLRNHDDDSKYISKFKVFGSNDGTTWTDIQEFTTQASDYPNNEDKYWYGTFSSPPTFSYYRLVINTMASSPYAQISNVSYFGTFADDIATIGDLSGVDLTTTAPVEGQALVWDNTNSKWKPGSVAAAGGGGGGGSYDTISLDRKGQVLEILTGVCDGRSVTVESGTYTLPVGTKQQLSGDPFVDVNGTNISYKPPSGTKQVVYSMLIHMGAIIVGHTDVMLNFIVLLDGNEITKSLITERPGNKWAQGWIDVQFVFDIGNVSSDDYANGKLASWNTHKIIKVMGREAEPGSWGSWINSNHNIAPSGSTNTYGAGQVYPQMTIKAIGDESISVGVSALTKENSLTIPNFTGTYTTNKLYNQSNRLKFNGETILTSNNPTINLKGQVLETLTGIFDGRSVSVASGTYTLKDVTAVQTVAGYGSTPTDSWVDHVNTDINYKPPAGTRQVKITYTVATDVATGHNHSHRTHPRFRLVVDGVIFTSQTTSEQDAGDYYNATHNRIFILDIGQHYGVDDIANGKLANWDISKHIKLQVGSESYATSYNITRPPNYYLDTTMPLLKPSIEIQAIGEGLAGVQKVVNVLGPGGIRNISDIQMNPDNEIDWSGDSGSGSGNQYSGYAAFHSSQLEMHWGSYWLSDGNLYNTTTGVYTGSQLTGTLGGEWLQIKFPSKATIHKIGIQSPSHSGNNKVGIWNAPKSFVLFGSNDGTSFNNLQQFTVTHLKEYIDDTHYDAGTEATIGSRLIYRALSTPQTYQYFRLVVTQNFGNHTNYSEFSSGSGTGAVNILYMAYYGTLESEYANIGDLSDVSDTVSTALTGQTLIYNGSEWAPGAATSTGNVVVSTAFDGGGALKLTEFTGTSTASKLYNDKSSGENVLKFDGKTVLTGEGINRKGQVLETLAGICDGRSITIASGTYTLENVTAKQSLTSGSGNSGNFVKVNGSVINYKPPLGTRQVIYEYTVHLNKLNITHPIGLWKLFVDSAEVTNFRSNTSADHISVQQTFMYVFEIGGTDDIANGKLSSWDTFKTIKLEASAWHTSHYIHLHETSYWIYSDASTRNGGDLSPPKLKIQAIGEGVVSVGRNITAITRNLKRRISHPDDGLVVAYHVSGDEDTYHGSYPLENMFKYVGSSTGISDVGGHSDNYFTSANNWNWTTAKNPAFNATVAPGIIGPYVGAQFSEKFVFTSIRILPRVGNGYAQSCPRVFYIYGSNDRVNWDLIFSKSLPSITTTVPSQSVGPYTVGSYTTWEIPDNGVGYKNFHMIVANTYPVSNYTYANFNCIDLSIYGYEADITASIANLKDVDTISTQPEIGQGLVWNGNKWVPGKQVNEGVALDGQVLETLAGVCDGRTVVGSSGTYTLENVTAKLSATETFIDITGSKINYKPPVGVKTVIYEFEFQHNYNGTNGWGYYKFLLNGTQVGEVFELGFDQYGSGMFQVSFPFEIGQDDLANGKILTWDTSKEIKIQFREHSANSQVEVHTANNWKSLTSETGLVKPRIKITAIGNKLYQPAQIVRTLEGGDGTKLISDISTYTGYEITASVNQHAAPQHPQMNADNAFFHRGYDGGHFWSANTSGSERFYGHNGNGLYIGSTTTATNIGNITGEWIQINFNKLVKVYHCVLIAESYGRAPKDYSILGSHDGIHWTVIHQQVNGPALSDSYNDYNYQRRRTNYSHTGTAYVDHGGQKTTFPSPVTYQYFRCIVQNQYPDADEYVWINDLEYYGSFFDEVGISKKVSDLIDVDLTAPSDGEALIYDASISKWKPGGNAALNFAPNIVKSENIDTSVVNTGGVFRRFGVSEGGTSGGLEVTIVPTTLTSKIRLSISLCYGLETKTTHLVRIIRTVNGVSKVILGSKDPTIAAADNTTYTTSQVPSGSFTLSYNDRATGNIDHHAPTTSYQNVDEPNTLSPVTYHIQIGSYSNNTTRRVRWNRQYLVSGMASTDLSILKSTLIAEEVMGSKALVSHNGYSFNMQPDLIFANNYDTASNHVNLAGWETPFAFPTDKITNTNTSVYSYDAGKITILQDGYYRAIFRVGTSSLNTSGEDARLASAGVAISTDGGASYTTESFNYAGGYGGANDYDSATNNIILKLNKNDIIFFHGRGSMWSYSLGFSVERLEGTQPLTQEGALVLPEFTGTDTTNRLYAENGLLKFNGKPVDNHSVKNRKGQVLEILQGQCDGSTITVDSGTYTLPDATRTSVYIVVLPPDPGMKDPDSEITYKAPAGTERIIIKYTGLFSKADADGIIQAKLYVDGAALTSLNPGFFDGYHRERGKYAQLGPMTFTAIVTSQHINLQVSHTYHFQVMSAATSREINFWRDPAPAADWMWPQLEITAIGDAAIQNATVVTGQSSVYFSGWVDGDSSSQCGTVTLSDGTAAGLAFHNYSYHSNYNALQYNNIGGCMNNSNGEFTVPHTGLYQINMSVVNSTTDKRALVYLHMSNPLKNYKGNANPDTAFIEVNRTSSTSYNNQQGVSHTMHFQAGERFYFYQYDGTNGAVNDMWLTITALQDQVPQTITARPGMTLETLAGVCDGRSITVASGTYTLQDAKDPNYSLGGQILNETWQDIRGSIISYKPPPGTRQVVFKFHLLIRYLDTRMTTYTRLIIDNSDRIFFKSITIDNSAEHEVTLAYVIDIGNTDDITKAKFLNWDTPKTLKIQARNHSSSNNSILFQTQYDAENSNSDQFVYPTLEIQAIGDGPGIRPASGGNIISKTITEPYVWNTIPGGIPGLHISQMDITITPISTDSVIELKWNIFYECHHDIIFRVTRNYNGTDVLVIPADEEWKGGIGVVPFYNNVDSTPHIQNLRWYDEPNTLSPVTYKVWIGWSGGVRTDEPRFNFNRSDGSSGALDFESGISTVLAIEHNKHARPYDEDGALTIPTFTGSSTAGKLYNDGGTLKFDGRPLGHKVLGAKGQILETLEGLCDGRTVIGASGTYTLPNVTAAQDLTETYTDLTGSLINYKPPSGTKIVVYSLKVQANVGGGSYWNCGYQLYIDDVAFGVINLQGTAAYVSQEEIIEIRIYITGTDDYANYNIASWETLKTIKLKCRERNSSRQSKMHVNDYYVTQVGGPADGSLVKPTMKIQAIGDGPSYSPATGTNIIPKTITDPYQWDIPDGIPGLHISPMDITITPTATDSVIELKWNIFYECIEDVIFRVTRNYNGTDVLVLPADQKWKGGLGVATTDAHTSPTHSTPSLINIRWYDEPNTLLPVTYKVWAGWSGGANTSEPRFSLNRTDASNDSNAFERGNSTVLAIEHAKRGNPLDAENALSIPEFAGSDPDNKLYNNGGVLHFNGNPVGSGGVMMQFEDTNLLSHQGSYTLKHNETNFCVANENAQLSTFRLTQIGSSGTGKYNVSVVVKNNNAGKLTAIKEQSSTVTVIPIENIYTKVRYQTEPTRDGLIEWFPFDADNKDAIGRKREFKGGSITDATNFHDSKFDDCKCYGCGPGVGGFSSPAYKWSEMGQFTIMFWWKMDNRVNSGSKYFTVCKLGGDNYYTGDAGILDNIDDANGYGFWCLGYWNPTTDYHRFYTHNSGATTHYIAQSTQICKVHEWNHFAFVYNSSSDFTVYFNGVPTPTKASDGGALTWMDGTYNNWTGVYEQDSVIDSIQTIKDYRVYNRALSAGELTPFLTTIKDTNAGGVAVGNIKPPINLTKNELVSVEVRPIGGEHNKYTTKVNVDLMGNSGTVLDGTSKWDNDTQGISYSDGNVGIGILNPSEKLSISDNVRIDGLIKPKGTSGTPGQVLSLSDDGLSMKWKNETVATVSTSMPGITSSNGNIGIGMTPTSKLQVNGDFHIKGTNDNWGTPGKGLYMRYSDGYGGYQDEAYIQSIDRTGGSYTYYPLVFEASKHWFKTGNVGIGTANPIAPLHISGHNAISLSGYSYWWASGHNSTGSGSGGGGHHIGLVVEKRSWLKDNILVSSDRRIKENIEDVPDDLALQQVRNIPTRYYEYKDKINKGESKTIGFIAQEVKEVLPMAVTEQASIIPNENRALNNIEWREYEDKYKLATDLQNVSGVKYRFYVTNDLSDNEVMKEIVGNADNTFTFEEKWEYVFCYGKEVDDFHTLDKQKLFALNFSATQELDRKVARLESENAELKAELAAIKAHLGL